VIPRLLYLLVCDPVLVAFRALLVQRDFLGPHVAMTYTVLICPVSETMSGPLHCVTRLASSLDPIANRDPGSSPYVARGPR
jgi:hypothetical protein